MPGFAPQITASGGDDDLFGYGCGGELDGGVVAGLKMGGLRREAWHFDPNVSGGSGGREVEVAGAVRGGAQRASGSGEENDRACDGARIGINDVTGEMSSGSGASLSEGEGAGDEA
jgi:hypothetical protein